MASTSGAAREQQKVEKRNSVGYSSRRRPSLLSAMKVYKEGDDQKTQKSTESSGSRKSSVTPEIKVETNIDESSSRPLLLSPHSLSVGVGAAASIRQRSSSFSRQGHEPLLKPVPESSTPGARVSLKTPTSADGNKRPAGRRNSFCVSREVKQKHSSLKTLGIFK